ncbi:MAG: hypothetical protein R2725_05240 [Solirubrobacterales bacterium]
MFNPLRADQLIAGMGRTMRAAAAADGPADDYARGQLLSAYSISRLLASEVRAQPELLAWLRGEALAALERSADPAAAPAGERIAAAGDPAAIGEALVDLFAELRREGRDSELRDSLHAVLREMAARELAVLAARPEDARVGSG